MTESTPSKYIRTFFTLVGAVGVGYLGFLAARSLIDQNAAQQLNLLIQKATLQANGIQPTGTSLPVESPTTTSTPNASSTPEATQTNILIKPELPRLDSGEWPTSIHDFYETIMVPDDQISPEYKADSNYRPLQEGMITQEFDKQGNWTGAYQVLLERDAGNGDQFPFVVIRNSGQTMQYGYMHDPNLRAQAGFTASEVAALGIGENHIGAGIPVTGNSQVAVEGLTFYPLVNNIDGSGNIHFIWSTIGADMQSLDARIARSMMSNIGPLELDKGNITISIPGIGLTTFDGNDNPIYRVNHPHILGGGLPNRIGSFTDLPKSAQRYQRDPNKGIRQVI